MSIRCKVCDYTNSDSATHCLGCGADLKKHGQKVDSQRNIYTAPPQQTPPPQAATPTPQPKAIQRPPAPRPVSPTAAKLSNKPHLETSGGRKYYLSPNTSTSIGSQGCAILLSDTGIQPRHAQVVSQSTGYTVAPQEGAIKVNGQPITSEYALQAGDKIELTATQVLTYNGPSTPTSPTPTTPQPPPASPVASPNKPVSVSPTSWGIANLKGQVEHIDGPHLEAINFHWVNFTWRLISLGYIKPVQQKLPTHNLRVRDDQGVNHSVKMKGELLTGAINQGDEVSFWGTWSDQHLIMSRAYNHHTKSAVRLRHIDSFSARAYKYGLIALLIFIVLLASGIIL